jgi:hypothetical protein
MAPFTRGSSTFAISNLSDGRTTPRQAKLIPGLVRYQGWRVARCHRKGFGAGCVREVLRGSAAHSDEAVLCLRSMLRTSIAIGRQHEGFGVRGNVSHWSYWKDESL